MHVLLSDGTADDLALTRGETARFAGLLRATGIPVTLHLVPAARHDLGYVRAELPTLWSFLDTGWST